MIVIRCWHSKQRVGSGITRAKYYYEGWFLLGIIPLFIRREFN